MVIKKLYNPEQISMIKQTLVKEQQHRETSRHYEIRVDAMIVVPRTTDLELFDSYEDFITDETKTVEIMIYFGQSRRSTRYIFLMKEEKPRELSGIDVDKIVDEKVSQMKQQWEQDQMKKELLIFKKQKEEADEYIDKLQKVVDDLKSQRKLGDLQWGEIIGAAGESLLRRNTHLLAKVPGMSGLAGIIDADNKNPKKEIETSKPEVEASFEMKKENSEEISKEDKDRLDFLKQLQERFSKEELNQVLDLLNLLANKTKAIEPTFIYAFQWKEQSAETKTETPKENNQEIKKEEAKPQQKKEQEQKAETKEEVTEKETSAVEAVKPESTPVDSSEEVITNISY